MYSVLRGAVLVFVFVCLFVCFFVGGGRGGGGRKDAELGRKLNLGRKGIHLNQLFF